MYKMEISITGISSILIVPKRNVKYNFESYLQLHCENEVGEESTYCTCLVLDMLRIVLNMLRSITMFNAQTLV